MAKILVATSKTFCYCIEKKKSLENMVINQTIHSFYTINSWKIVFKANLNKVNLKLYRNFISAM